MIEFVQGDMFATPADIRVNTVNCVGVMGAGMALAFKTRYPAMFRNYQRACRDGKVRPGHLHIWRSLEGDWVINFPTKRDWREPSRYEDIDAGLDALRDYLRPLGSVNVAVPALGCGHGELDWSRVSQMVKEKLGDLPAMLRVFAPLDSRNAGVNAQTKPTEAEIGAAEQLGYTLVWRPDGRFQLEMSSLDLNRQWIALLTSRNPREREQRALQSIATQLVREYPDSVLALVHSGRTTEDIAQLFANAGNSVCIVLPFGVLTRRSVSGIAKIPSAGAISLISAASPTQGWSRPLMGEAMGLLRENAAAVLVSDPEPNWLMKHSSAWRQHRIGFLRYDTLPEKLYDDMAILGAVSIGRRSEDGSPNLAVLFSREREDRSSADRVNASALTQPAKSHELIVDLNEYPASRWPELMRLIRNARPEKLQLSVSIGDSASAAGLSEQLTNVAKRSRAN